MGLGDVYLGAPVATPLDPRHRLVTTKYNPARTWTVENVVGIGGAYLCIYGMEGPGGYQLFGRTCQVWNTHRITSNFTKGHPWLLRFFDIIRFYPVSPMELSEFRENLPLGRVEIRTETSQFHLREYLAELEADKDSIAIFQSMQRKAFAEERERWAQAGLDKVDAMDAPGESLSKTLEEGQEAIPAPLTGTLLRIEVSPGTMVKEGQLLFALESMKMEFQALAPRAGVLSEIHVSVGQTVNAGQMLAILEASKT